MKRLFNPFEKYSEKQLLLIGLPATAAGAVIAWLCKARFDGVLDVHFAEGVTLAQTFADLVVDMLTLLLFLVAVAFFVNRKTRVVDLFSAVVVSRLPFCLLPLFNCTGWMSDLGTEVEAQLRAGEEITWVPGATEIVLIVLFSLVMVLLLVWAIALLYNGFRVATNARGALPIVLFIAAVLLAEIASKIVLYYLELLFT